MKGFANRLTEFERREFLAGIAYASLGVSVLPTFAAEGESKPKPATAKRVIFLYMDGGMSHIDTFDPKTAGDVKGRSAPLKTNADGVQISNKLPNLAKHGNKLAIVRGLSTKTGDHAGGKYLMHTAYSRRPGVDHPQMGSWAQHFLGRPSKSMPASVVIAGGNPGPGFLPPDHSPFPIGDPNKGIREYLPKIGKGRFNHRVGLAQKFGQVFEEKFPHDDVAAYADFFDETVKFFDDKTVNAFDVNKEPAEMKNRYGNSRFGRGLLLARRLLQNNVRFVEVRLNGWDRMHQGLDAGDQMTAQLDGPMAALLGDLQARGMLKDTMVVLATEFGRTPKISQRGGRDHHPRAFSAVLAGGGVRGGQAIGQTDAKGIAVTKDKFEPKDLHATIAKALGLPIDKRVHGAGGRPFFVANEGKVIQQAFS